MGKCELWAGEMRDESSPLLSSSINEEYWSAPGGLVATAAVLIITSILFGALDILSVALWLAFHCTFYVDFGYSRRFFKKIFHFMDFMWEFVVSLSCYSQSTQTECIEVGYNNCICSLAPTC